MANNIQFRPHHFLCTYCFEGKGYHSEFVENYQAITDNLQDDTVIEITEHTDSICQPCPHRQGKQCASQTKIESLDQRHAKALDLSAHPSITWGEAKARIRKNITTESFQALCAGCEWQPLGICERKIANH